MKQVAQFSVAQGMGLIWPLADVTRSIAQLLLRQNRQQVTL